MFGVDDVFSVCFCLFVKGSRWTLSISLLGSVGSIWRLSVRSSFTFSVVYAAVSFFLSSGSLTHKITRQDRLEYCLKQLISLASSSLVRFDKSPSLCHSWTSCSKLFTWFVKFWIFWSWSWIADIDSSLECYWDSDDACVCWSDDDFGALFWVLMSLALFPFDLLLLAIFISDFSDKILFCWFIWLVMILVARVVSNTRLISPCSNSNSNSHPLYNLARDSRSLRQRQPSPLLCRPEQL